MRVPRHASSSQAASRKRTFHVLIQPDISCANDTRLSCCLTLPNEGSTFGPLFRRCIMRCLLKVSIPVVEGNAAIADGTLGSTINSILADMKPEAAYFAEDNGARTGFIFF